MNIVTGYTGQPHVTANEAQALNHGIFGPGNYVLDVGNKFAASMPSANEVTIQDGEGVIQGVQFRIPPGHTNTVALAPGTSGYNRIDLICARYTKSSQTGIEAVNLVIVRGTPSASTPSEPTYNTGNILLGDSLVDFPLYKVTITGVTPVISQLFRAKMSMIAPPDINAVETVWQMTGTDAPYQVTEDGWYALRSIHDGSTAACMAQMAVMVNGVKTIISSVVIPNPSAITGVTVAAMTQWFYLRAGQTIYPYVFGGTGGTTALLYAPCMS